MTLSELLDKPHRLVSFQIFDIDCEVIYGTGREHDKVRYSILKDGKCVNGAYSKRMAKQKMKRLQEEHLPNVKKSLNKLKKLGLGDVPVLEEDNNLVIKTEKSCYIFYSVGIKS